ncbi:phosphodiesterase, partial [Achromobacter xylosoxidans]|nr:phosphodiesterase [Achromobacter xylosoxidans]
AQLRAAFPDHGYLQGQGPFIQYAVETYPLRLLALDTVVPMKSHGELCDERLGWLAARLAEQPDRPTLVLMHHPPFQTGIEHMDDIGLLAGGPELESIVARYPRVERVLCGHLHRTIFRRFGGTIASTCPGTAHQLALELGPRPTLQYIMEPPGYQLHWWHDGALVTHHAVIGEYPGPYPFA